MGSPTGKLFLCPPTHYDVVYSINPWMDPSVPVDKRLAWEQWTGFVRELESLGQELELIQPAEGCPDMVFLGDAGIPLGERFLCSRFRHEERAPEADHYVRAFGQAGYRVLQTPPDAVLEGLGDICLSGERAILGHGPRTSPEGFAAFRRFAPFVEVIAEVELCDPRFYHLATAVVFLDADTVLYYPRALTPRSVERLEAAVGRAIPVGDEDILQYQACNCVVLGKTVLIDGATRTLRGTLNRLGFDVRVCPASEFKKGGGSLRCLVLPALDARVAAEERV